MPRAWFDKLNTWARNYGQKGLGYIICLNEDFKGPIASNIKKENLNKLVKRVGLQSGDSVFFISDKKEDANKFASVVRTELCNQLKLLDYLILICLQLKMTPKSYLLDIHHH